MKYNDSDLGYISGLFDIAGNLKIETPYKKALPSLYIWITSKSFKLMEYLQRFGANISQKSDGNFRARWRDLRAYELLKAMEPILKIKSNLVNIGIEFIDHKKSNSNNIDVIPYQVRIRLERG